MKNNEIKILVVDDNPDILQATVRILRREGLDVISSLSGADALKLMNEKPDLVLLDVVMDDMDGFEVCRRIKSNPEWNDSFVVFTSGTKITTSSQTEGLNLGADGYITRPFSRAEFIARIHAFLRIYKVKQKLASAEEWLKISLNSMADALIVTDLMSNVSFMNPAAENLIEWELVEIINKPVDPILRIKNLSEKVIRQNLILKFITEKNLIKKIDAAALFTKNGKRIIVDITISAIVDQNNSIGGVVILIRDITSDYDARQELDNYKNNLELMVKERTQKLEEKNASLQHYHELFIGREFRIKELKNEIKELKDKLEVFQKTMN